MKKVFGATLAWNSLQKTVAFLCAFFVLFSMARFDVHAADDSKPFGFPVENLNATMSQSFQSHANRDGYDLALAEGTPVYALFDGTATYYQRYHKDTKVSMSYGNYIEITSHDGKYTVLYAHLSNFEGVSLRPWIICGVGGSYNSNTTRTETVATKAVSEGDLIGYTGNTGNSSGAHLHLGLKINGAHVDPDQYISRQWCAKDAKSHQPVIFLDRYSSPGAGMLYVRGWAYDPDCPEEPVNVHIYFGDDCVTGELYTGVYRPDVPAAGYPCGQNQGFEATIQTDKYGTKMVRAFAINIGAGSVNTMANATPDITIPQDTEGPTLTNPKVTDITSSSYTVSVTATDNVHVREVKMPSWVTGQTGSDAVWHQASQPGVSTYSCTIPKVAGKTTHWTHVYAYDLAGNSTCGEIRLDDVKVGFNANGGTCSTSSKTVTAVTAFENYVNPYGTLPTPTRTNYNFDGWYTAASGGSKITSSSIISQRTAHTLYAHWTHKGYYLDLQGEVNGEIKGNLNNYAIADIYINGKLVAQDVSDYYTRHPAGTTYEIKNIRPKDGVSYDGVYGVSRSGTVGNADAFVYLSFSRNSDTEYTATPKATAVLNGHVYEFYEAGATWYLADYICQAKGGYLATISDAEENALIQSISGTNSVWLGGSDQEQEGSFTWITEESFNYNNWNTNAPDNAANAADGMENHLQMNEKGLWNDACGALKIGFICEYDACNHTYKENVVAPTCTEQGYTTHTCAVCSHTYTDNYTDVLDHSYSYSNNGENHIVGCDNCNYYAEDTHEFIDGECICGATRPISDSTLKFNMNISAGAEMVVNYNFMASVISKYEDFYLEVKKNIADGDPIITTYGISSEHIAMGTMANPITGEVILYNAAYTGINAKEMGDSFETTLYAVDANGKIYKGETVTSSIKDFLLEKLTDSASIPEMKTMAVDMLSYGAAAQIRFSYDTDNLVTSSLTAQQLALGTQEVPEAVDRTATTGSAANVNTNITINSKVELSLSCIAAGQANPAGVKCIITDQSGKVLAELATENIGGVMYKALYDNVGAKEMREVITATFYNAEGTVLSKSVSWSVESYVAQIRAKATATADEIAMVNAMLVYGDSVAAYMDAK